MMGFLLILFALAIEFLSILLFPSKVSEEFLLGFVIIDVIGVLLFMGEVTICIIARVLL